MYRIIKKRCIVCGQCVESCQKHAIYMIDDEVCIDNTKCNDCGLCIQVCPQGAITNRISPLSRVQREKVVKPNRNGKHLSEYNQ